MRQTDSQPNGSHNDRYERLAKAVGGEIVNDPSGSFCRVIREYRHGFVFGDHTLPPVDLATEVAVASFTATDQPGEVPLAELTFIDTETTGLGGAGVVPFLVGIGSVTPDGFEVRQYLLPDYADEAAMLERILAEVTETRTLVSYNGVAFDLNLLKDRMIINRVARQIPCRHHFDLLHVARRLYRRRLADCKLTNIEREIFGFHRVDDLPGYLVPGVYFDWLNSENLDLMDQVLEHNRLDILTLYFLVRHLNEVFSSEGEALKQPQDIYSLSRVYGRRRDNDKVVKQFYRAQEAAPEGLADDQSLYFALAFKRSGDWDRAVEIWLRVAVGRSREALRANLELAKYYEHRAKDIDKALGYAHSARQLGRFEPRQTAQIDGRLDRLRAKRQRR